MYIALDEYNQTSPFVPNSCIDKCRPRTAYLSVWLNEWYVGVWLKAVNVVGMHFGRISSYPFRRSEDINMNKGKMINELIITAR